MRTKASGSDQAHMLLRRRILRLDLKPGTELDEVTLSHSLGVSRTPIREALIRLSSEGLVTLQRGRGARVTPLDLTTFRSFFEGLDILQRAVTRLAALRRTPADLKTIKLHLLAFEKGAKSFDSEALNDANYEFHTAIGNAARSKGQHDAHGLTRVFCLGNGLTLRGCERHQHEDSQRKPADHALRAPTRSVP